MMKACNRSASTQLLALRIAGSTMSAHACCAQACTLVDSRGILHQRSKHTKMPVFFKDGQSFSFEIGDEHTLTEEARCGPLTPTRPFTAI